MKVQRMPQADEGNYPADPQKGEENQHQHFTVAAIHLLMPVILDTTVGSDGSTGAVTLKKRGPSRRIKIAEGFT